MWVPRSHQHPPPTLPCVLFELAAETQKRKNKKPIYAETCAIFRYTVVRTQLIIGEDVTKMSDEYIATVGNEELIAVNQDAPLIGSAKRIIGGDLVFPCYGGLPAAINWTKTRAPVTIPSSTAWLLSGGAASTGSKLPGQTDIRSGEPGQISLAVVEQPLASLG